MIERLFVYGTLAPGKPNEHVLGAIGGSFERATIRGTLRNVGWGAAMGYPCIELHAEGSEVAGFVFSSENLSGHWKDLDAFEGEAYERVLAEVRLEDGNKVQAYVYAL